MAILTELPYEKKFVVRKSNWLSYSGQDLRRDHGLILSLILKLYICSSYKTLAWVGFEPTITEFRSDALTKLSGHNPYHYIYIVTSLAMDGQWWSYIYICKPVVELYINVNLPNEPVVHDPNAISQMKKGKATGPSGVALDIPRNNIPYHIWQSLQITWLLKISTYPI